MLKALLLVLILLSSWGAQASMCVEVFAVSSQPVFSAPGVRQAEDMIAIVDNLGLFHRSKRKRKKEIDHIRKDLEGIGKKLESRLKSNPDLMEPLKNWESYNKYWLQKAKEFEQLPAARQKELKESMELAMSLSLKHLISFLEAPSLARWQLDRLESLLLLHKQYPDVSVETALFLLNRQALKFYSRWDFVNCKY